jgi:predicted TIM-barrel fold metal-dependent hydrolase
MIAEGLFERFPSLRVMLVGGGFSWLPSWLWRQNLWYKRGRRSQAPWLTRLPSEYFVDHFVVTSESYELKHDPAQTERLLDAIPGLERVIVYASCFPHVGLTTPADVLERLPANWHNPVLRDNALGFYRWPTRRSYASPLRGEETGTLT